METTLSANSAKMDIFSVVVLAIFVKQTVFFAFPTPNAQNVRQDFIFNRMEDAR